MGFFDTNEPQQKVDNSLWVESYRPRVLDEYIGNDHLKEKVTDFIANNDIPHLLFYGKPGTGKCLDYTEMIDIEMEISDDEYEMLKKYEI